MKAALTSFTAPSDPVPTPRPERMSAEQAASVSANAFAGLMEHLGYLDATSIEQVREAYAFADLAHSDQWRSSGEPYITHPIAVTALCASWKLDAPALMAALLHDAMEDCGVTKADLAQRFGQDVAELVDRKSTRLNSSHQIISYAVFCLKKKNKKRAPSSTPQPLQRVLDAAISPLTYLTGTNGSTYLVSVLMAATASPSISHGALALISM